MRPTPLIPLLLAACAGPGDLTGDEAAPEGPSKRATIIFSGVSHAAAREARDILAADYDVATELWSAPSFRALRDDAISVERWNRLHPADAPRVPYVTEALSNVEGPIVAVTDYIRAVPDSVARWVPGDYTILGTDGFGRSDTREQLRSHFETDTAHTVTTVLGRLAAAGEIKPEVVTDAIARFGIDTELADPWDVEVH